MEVSINGDTPKLSILMGFSLNPFFASLQEVSWLIISLAVTLEPCQPRQVVPQCPVGPPSSYGSTEKNITHPQMRVSINGGTPKMDGL